MAERGERAGQGDKKETSQAATLDELGVSRTQSSRWQKLAAVRAEQFETYCRERWDMSAIHAERLTTGAQIVENLPTGNLPTSESQVRPLAALGTPDQQREAVFTRQTLGRPSPPVVGLAFR